MRAIRFHSYGDSSVLKYEEFLKTSGWIVDVDALISLSGELVLAPAAQKHLDTSYPGSRTRSIVSKPTAGSSSFRTERSFMRDPASGLRPACRSCFHKSSSGEEAATTHIEIFPLGATLPPSPRSLNSRAAHRRAHWSPRTPISVLSEGTFQETASRSKD